MANENMIQKHLDNFLAKIAGETPIDDKPRNSTEFWLNEIAENGGGGTTVVANPTLAGTEDTLTGLQVNDIKYAVPQTEKKYRHILSAYVTAGNQTLTFYFELFNGISTPYTDSATLMNHIMTNVLPNNGDALPVTGAVYDSASGNDDLYVAYAIKHITTTLRVMVYATKSTSNITITAFNGLSDIVLEL